MSAKKQTDVMDQPALQAFPKWVVINPTNLIFTKKPEWDEWQQVVPLFAYLRNAMPWWIGDFMLHGEEAFGQMISQVEDLFGKYQYNTVANYKSVCQRVAPERRVAELSFSHHQVVAKCNPTDQSMWLARALFDPEEQRMLTVAELDELVNPEQPGEGGKGEQESELPEARMSYDKLGEKILKLLHYLRGKAPDLYGEGLIDSAVIKVREALGKKEGGDG